MTKTFWTRCYAQRTQRMQASIIRELLKLTEKPNIISFGGGLPAADVFPLEAFQAAAQRLLQERGEQALQYSTTEGCPKLREMIARHTSRYGISVEPENILITNGSQQALDLIGKVFLDPGDRILVERPTYLGALQAWNAYQAEYICLDIDDEGMKTEGLETALQLRPKFIYALPNFQNPTGVTLSLARRRKLVEEAARHRIPLIEDDPYGQLRYEGDHLPSLAVLDNRLRGRKLSNGNVIYLSTFSKTLAPGLRVGWVLAPAEVIQRLVLAKQGADLHTSTFVQMLVHEVARGGFLDRQVHKIRSVYRERRDTMLAVMEKYFPPSVRWTRPQGGLFLWVTLPVRLDAALVLRAAIVEKVAFVPGLPFFPDGSARNTLRLNFSNATPEKIEEGIRRLGFVLARMLRACA